MAKKRRKPRARTNKNVPAVGILRDKADKLWSRAVRDDWNNQCAICGNGKVEAHHLIPRGHAATRYELRNGIALCFTHHKSDNDRAPHQNAAGFMSWLVEMHPDTAKWYIQNRWPTFNGTTNAAFYMGVIQGLRQYVEPEDFEKIVGVTFSAYLESNK